VGGLPFDSRSMDATGSETQFIDPILARRCVRLPAIAVESQDSLDASQETVDWRFF
jgi:hypothetical protein